MDGHSSAADHRSARSALMARAGATLFVGEGLLALLADAAEGADGWRALVVAAVAVAALGLAALVFFGHSHFARWQTHAISAFGALLIGVVVGVERPIYGLLYVWLALFIAAQMRPRAVAYHVAWILTCDAVAVTISDPVGRPAEAWLLLAGILAGSSAFVSFVRRYLTELAERERQARSVLDTLFRRAPVGLALFDRELRYVRVNDTLAAWTGVPIDAHAGKRIDEITPGLGSQVEPAMRRIFDTGEPEADIYARNLGRIYRSSRYPIANEHGEIKLIASITDDVTELEIAREQLDQQNRVLAEQARTDPITSCLNRRAFEQELSAALERAKSGSAVAVLYLDLDGFKAINDRYGHDRGDEVLRNFADRLRSVARTDDSIARIGGDEFALILPDIPGATAMTVASRLAERVHNCLEDPLRFSGGPIELVTSIGIAVSSSDTPDAESLIKQADAAMYTAKRSGGSTTFPANVPLRAVNVTQLRTVR